MASMQPGSLRLVVAGFVTSVTPAEEPEERPRYRPATDRSPWSRRWPPVPAFDPAPGTIGALFDTIDVTDVNTKSVRSSGWRNWNFITEETAATIEACSSCSRCPAAVVALRAWMADDARVRAGVDALVRYCLST